MIKGFLALLEMTGLLFLLLIPTNAARRNPLIEIIKRGNANLIRKNNDEILPDNNAVNGQNGKLSGKIKKRKANIYVDKSISE